MDIEQLDQQSEAVFRKLSKRGLRVNKRVFEELLAKYQPLVDKIESEIGANLSSTKEVAEYLLAHGVDLTKSETGRYRTGADVLKYLPQTPEIEKVMEGRSIKSFASLAGSLLKKVDSEGKLYPEYRFKPELGRVHAAGVNYLNWSEEFKAAIVPRPGYKIFSADQKQFESRILQHLSGDLNLKAALDSEDEFHAVMASEAFGIPLDQVTEDIRDASKEITFSISGV